MEVRDAIIQGGRQRLRAVILTATTTLSGCYGRHRDPSSRGERIRVYSVAKTLADLFKHRHKLGLDVALKALPEAWRERRFTMAELDRAARVCRMDRVMRSYVEAMVA